MILGSPQTIFLGFVSYRIGFSILRPADCLRFPTKSRRRTENRQSEHNSYSAIIVSITSSLQGHFSNLPSPALSLSLQTDKASLLAEVVHHVKELKRHAANVAPYDPTKGSTGGASWPFPGETDEVTLDQDPESSLIKASVCCDDRPDLLSDLNGAIRSQRLRAVKAEIATLGGRTKSAFVIEGGGGQVDLPALRRALKAVLEKPAAGAASASGSAVLGNKRPRFSRQLSSFDGFQ